MISDYKTKLSQAYEENEKYHSEILENENVIKDKNNDINELKRSVNEYEKEIENKENTINEFNSTIEKYIIYDIIINIMVIE